MCFFSSITRVCNKSCCQNGGLPIWSIHRPEGTTRIRLDEIFPILALFADSDNDIETLYVDKYTTYYELGVKAIATLDSSLHAFITSMYNIGAGESVSNPI